MVNTNPVFEVKEQLQTVYLYHKCFIYTLLLFMEEPNY